jgi:hypothetical protein
MNISPNAPKMLDGALAYGITHPTKLSLSLVRRGIDFRVPKSGSEVFMECYLSFNLTSITVALKL